LYPHQDKFARILVKRITRLSAIVPFGYIKISVPVNLPAIEITVKLVGVGSGLEYIQTGDTYNLPGHNKGYPLRKDLGIVIDDSESGCISLNGSGNPCTPLGVPDGTGNAGSGLDKKELALFT